MVYYLQRQLGHWFMNKKQIKDIKDSIRLCNIKLSTILPHLTEDKKILNKNYNQILIEKAVLRDKLMCKQPSFIEKIFKKINGNKKELICDYFK